MAEAQTTSEPKPTDSADNPFETIPGDPGAHGRFDEQARGSTLWTSIRLRRWLVGGGLAAAGATFAALAQRNGHEPHRLKGFVTR